MLRKIVRNRVPRRARIDPGVKLRSNPGIIVEYPHPNGYLGTIRPFTAKQTGAAFDAKSFHCSFAFAINTNHFIPGEQMELLLSHARLRANSRS